MKVADLRKVISAADRENLEKAFVEVYKQLKKGQKEEIEEELTAILEGKVAEKKVAADAVSFEELDRQIVVFIENAHAQNYFAPNRVIPKSQRPKWRFLVKNFIRELEKITPENENYPRSVKLLTDLYSLICEACNYYLFSTDDPFRSIGWRQQDFFSLVAKKTFAVGYFREDISRLLLLATTGGLSRESLYIQQELVLLGCLRTADVKAMTLEEAKRLIGEREGKLAGLKKYDNRIYYLEEAVNELGGMVLLLSVELGESEQGIKYYFQHCKQSRRETTLYCALRLMEWIENDELWLAVYEYGISKKITPRDELKEQYERRKKQG